MVLNTGGTVLNPGMWLFICKSFHLDPKQHLQQQNMSHRKAEATMNGLCFFLYLFLEYQIVSFICIFCSSHLRS